MIIKINKEKVRVGAPILNGEAVLIEVRKPSMELVQKDFDGILEEIKILNVKTNVFAESDIEFSKPLSLYEINSNYSFQIQGDCNIYIATKGIIEIIKSVYNLIDSDFEILIEKDWHVPVRPIRVYLPYTSVVEKYNELVSAIITLGTPNYRLSDGYVLYCEEIYPEHRAVIENDENVYIEE